jgi:dihydrofolate reductase
MRLAIIVARGRNHVIGRDGRLPWHLPADLAHFKATTMGAPVLMGRRTYQSIGRALPGRRNIVLSQTLQDSAAPAGVEVVPTLDEALRRVQDAPCGFVIGGQALYRATLPLADQIHLTEVDLAPDGDTWFGFDESAFIEVARRDLHADARNASGMVFRTLHRR